MPSLRDICEDKIPTKKFVPQNARREWAKILTGVLEDVVRFNDERAWKDRMGITNMTLGGDSGGEF